MPLLPHRDRFLPPRTPRILHLDIDGFLASVEQALHPKLRGRPVVVGGLPSERNLVMSCSYEARACGIRSGMLLAEAARLCPRAVFRRGDSQAAGRLREAVARILLAESPRVEVASIDDFYVDLGFGAHAPCAAFDTAVALRARIRSELCLPVTIGLGTNKLLARIAGKLAKPGGVCEILPGHERVLLAHLPLSALPGAGRHTGAALERFGLRTAGELLLVPREVLFASFGREGLVLHERAQGRDDEPVETTHALEADGSLAARPPRSLRRESTFEPEEGRREMVEAMLCYLVERAAAKLRGHGCVARGLEVSLVYVDTRPPSERRIEKGEGGSYTRRRALAAPSDSTDELARLARVLLAELPRRRALVKRVGVALHELAESPGWQGRLFSDPGADRAERIDHADPAQDAGARGSRADRQRRLDRALDALRDKHGFGRILRGNQATLRERYELGPDGYRLRTPSLNQ